MAENDRPSELEFQHSVDGDDFGENYYFNHSKFKVFK